MWERKEIIVNSQLDLSPTGLNGRVGLNSENEPNSISMGLNFQDLDTIQDTEILEHHNGGVIVRNFDAHRINQANRYGEMTDFDLVEQNQSSWIIMSNENGRIIGITLPKHIENGEIVASVELRSDNQDDLFNIRMFEINNGELIEMERQSPDRNSGKILHATQILGHVKDACDMQSCAHSRNSLDRWQFRFPPTHRRRISQEKLSQDGVPTHEVTATWSYGPESSQLPSDFREPESFETVLGFIAANPQICREVREGIFPVVSTNFKQEGNIFKMINPEIELSGINFTFLDGRPGDRMKVHSGHPKMQRMLLRVQDSLDSAPQVLNKIAGKEVTPADWWNLTEAKMQNVDTLFYRTFRLKEELPRAIQGTEIIQIPHPIPEIKSTKAEARRKVESIIGKSLEGEKLVILPGASEDGLFDERVIQLLKLQEERDDVTVIAPLKEDDKRLKEHQLNGKFHVIGFREDWMDIIPAADVTLIRGSWGEILDVVAAGVTPIILSPGKVPEEGDLGYLQFLTEVSGERAVNISLLVEELSDQGVGDETINGLLADIADRDSVDELANAVDFALNEADRGVVRRALTSIKKDGIKWMVELHERLLDGQELRVEDIHHEIWSK